MVESSKLENSRFRERIYAKDAANTSRLPMSSDARDCILGIVRGLCRSKQPIALGDAEQGVKRALLQKAFSSF